MINVFMCFDNGLENHWKHVVNSVVTNTNSKVSFYFVLDRSVSQKAINKIENYPIKINTKIIDRPNFRTPFVATVKSKMQYVRFFLADLFPQFDRGIYLDNDVLFLGDIKELWHQALFNNVVGAVRDPYWEYAYDTCHFQGGSQPLFKEKYPEIKSHLSGQLLINFAIYRNYNFRKKFIDFVEENKVSDMLAMNIVLEGKIRTLDDSYSVPANNMTLNSNNRFGGKLPLEIAKSYQNPEILHSHGDVKFWHKESPFHEMYNIYNKVFK